MDESPRSMRVCCIVYRTRCHIVFYVLSDHRVERARENGEREKMNPFCALICFCSLLSGISIWISAIADTPHCWRLLSIIVSPFNVHTAQLCIQKTERKKIGGKNSHLNPKADADAFGCWYLKISAFRAYVANTNTRAHTHTFSRAHKEFMV